MIQRVFHRPSGHYVVLTRIGREHRAPGKKWEVEVTSKRGHTYLRYFSKFRHALHFIFRQVGR
ncbi:MAG: hypothetical protein HOV97_05705 [Nonomuraea sp.]|nr:hypothetical protein [Nonomuraea sp.]